MLYYSRNSDKFCFYFFEDSVRRQTRIRSNWCPICRKKIEDSHLKVHFAKEHPLDSFVNIKCPDKVPLQPKKLKIKKQIARKNPLKIIQNNKKKTKTPSIKCDLCGIKCKGVKGLNIHLNTHNQPCSYTGDVPLNKQYKIKNPKIEKSQKQMNTNVLISANDIQTATAQTSTVFPGYVKLMDDYENVDDHSEKYLAWIKEFSSRKFQYPLTPELTHIVSEVVDDIMDFLLSHKTLKSVAFNFLLKRHDMLSDIMLNHVKSVFGIYSSN